MGVLREAGPRPQRRGAFVVRYRVRLGGIVSGMCTVLGGGATVVLGVGLVATVPGWVPVVWAETSGPVAAILGIVVGPPSLLVLPLLVWGFGERPGNVAQRRTVLVLDEGGIWLYPWRHWRRAPVCLPWRTADGAMPVWYLRAWSEEPCSASGGEGPAPLIVPWDHLTFQTDHQATTLPLLHLTATAEQIVAAVRRYSPNLEFTDDRVTPAGLRGALLRHRRSVRRLGARWAHDARRASRGSVPGDRPGA